MFECGQRLDLGMLFAADTLGERCPASPDSEGLATESIGRWACDLADNSLSWTDPVFDLFDLPRDALISRDEIVGLYCDESRAAMERLRAYAIKHQRGFTVDLQIRTAGGRRRWMRLLAAPVCDGDRVVRLQGLKQDISREYLRGLIR